MIFVSNRKAKKLSSNKTQVFKKLFDSAVVSNHNFATQNTFIPGVVFQIDNANYFGTGNTVPLVAGQNVKGFYRLDLASSFSAIDLNYRRIELDLTQIPEGLNFRSLTLNNMGRILNLSYIGDPRFDSLRTMRLTSIPETSFDVANLALERKKDLVNLHMNGIRKFYGTFDIGQNTKLKTITLSTNKFTTADIDYLARRLYEEGSKFTATGKFISLQGNQRASGTVGDSVDSGTGQGFISGIIDDFGWTVTQ